MVYLKRVLNQYHKTIREPMSTPTAMTTWGTEPSTPRPGTALFRKAPNTSTTLPTRRSAAQLMGKAQKTLMFTMLPTVLPH